MTCCIPLNNPSTEVFAGRTKCIAPIDQATGIIHKVIGEV
jgi:hypothetical protein